MRRIGSVLMAIGAVVGVGTGLAVLGNVDIPGVGSWLVAVAVAKLGFIAAFSLIAAGALLRRAAARTAAVDGASTEPGMESPALHPLSSGTPPAESLVQREPALPPRAQR